MKERHCIAFAALAALLVLLASACSAPPPQRCQPLALLSDNDGDDFGDDSLPVEACEGQMGIALQGGDCDDHDPTRSPAATEVCDGVDNDCDGQVDEGGAMPQRWYADADGDGYGDPTATSLACQQPDRFVDDARDCDDTRADIHPEADELCDGVDNECDGQVDEAPLLQRTWFLDADADGVGTDGTTREDCRQPEGFAPVGGDCDDTDPRRWPGNPEVCNDGVDNDCDGTPNGCQIEGRIDLTHAEDVIIPDVASGRFGWAIDCQGDINGDEFDDIVIGQPTLQISDDAWGYSYFIAGPIYDTINTEISANRFSPMPNTNTSIGGSVSFIGDINHDGNSDALIGSFFSHKHGLYIALSPINNHGDYVEYIALGQRGDTDRVDFGYNLMKAPDINFDENVNFVVSTKSDNTSSTRAALIYIFTGTDISDYSLDNAWHLAGSLPSDWAGFSLASSNRSSNGRTPFILVGAPKYSQEVDLGGLVYVMTGPMDRSAELLRDVSHLLVGYEAGGQAGWSVSNAGDTDGDGFDDILVGAPFSGVGTNASRGATYLVRGPIEGDLSLDQAATRLLGEAAGDQSGWSVAGAGDLNGDGFDDVLIGAPLNGNNGVESGAVYLFYGPLPLGNVSLADADAVFVGKSAGERVGHAIVGMCDINADGRSDFIFSSFQSRASGRVAGAVWVIYGRGL